MQLYNSLSHKKEEFVPNVEGKVNMYTCGPYCTTCTHRKSAQLHYGGCLKKYLRYVGYDVKRVMNITDVGHLTSDGDTGDDKMLKGAKREHKTVMEIAKYYTDAFFEDCTKLNIKRPDVVEPATHCIADFIKVISSLIEKGYAYEAGGNIHLIPPSSKSIMFSTTSRRKTLRLAFVKALRRTVTRETRQTSFCGSQSQSLTIRNSSGTARGE